MAVDINFPPVPLAELPTKPDEAKNKRARRRQENITGTRRTSKGSFDPHTTLKTLQELPMYDNQVRRI